MNNRFLLFLWTLALGLVLIFGDLPAVCAQESDTDEFTLEEITVTAEKRAENVQKVPIAMEVITGDMMIEMGKNNIDEILRDISNVIINQSSDGMRIALRGLANSEGTQRGMTVSTPTVAINVDGAYNASNLAGQNLFDIERVEVLMGPQSTMYSSNSPGGIINVVTAAPKTDKFSVSGSIEYGNYNLLNTQASVNVPVIQDKVALRAAINLTKRDSYIEGADSTTAEDTKSARIKALYQPSDILSFTLTGNWSKRGGGGGMGGSVKPFDYQDGYWYTISDLNSPGTRDGKVTDPWTASGADISNATWDSTSKGLSAEMVLNMGFASLTVVPSYSKEDSSSFEPVTVGRGADAEELDANRTQERIQKSVEARMTSSSDFTLFTWIVGGTVYKGEETRGNDYVDPDDFDEYNTNDQNSKAFFANITYPITDRFRATGGYRRSWDTVDNTEAAQEAMGQTNLVSTNSQEYSKPDYKVGVEYDVSENTMVYADRNSSYRVSGMATGDQPPERLVAYTVGSKNRFLNNKLQMNASVFYYKYKDKKASVGRYYGDYTETEIGWDMEDNTTELDGIIGTIDPDTGEEHVFTISDGKSQNWGNFRSYGLDISTSAIITSKDRLNLSVSYLNTKWTDLYFHFEYYNVFPDEDYSGQEGIYSPNWSANATYEHNFNLWNGGTLTGTLSAQYQSEFLLAWKPSWQPFTYQEPHTIWDISFSYAHPDGRWTLNAYTKNIFNYAVKTSFMDMGGAAVMMVGSPRTYGGIFSFRF